MIAHSVDWKPERSHYYKVGSVLGLMRVAHYTGSCRTICWNNRMQMANQCDMCWQEDMMRCIPTEASDLWDNTIFHLLQLFQCDEINNITAALF